MSTARGKARRALQEGRAAVAKKKTDTRGHATRGRLDILDDIRLQLWCRCTRRPAIGIAGLCGCTYHSLTQIPDSNNGSDGSEISLHLRRHTQHTLSTESQTESKTRVPLTLAMVAARHPLLRPGWGHGTRTRSSSVTP